MKSSMKKIFAVVFLLTLIVSSFSYAAETNYTNTQGDPRIVLQSISNEEIEAGESYELVLYLKNEGNYTATDIEYILEVGDDTPITITDLQSSRYEEKLYPSYDTTLSFAIEVDYDAEEGIYPLTLSETFTNLDGDAYELEETFNISILESEEVDNFTVSLASDYDVVAGEDFTATLSVENTGLNTRDLEVSLLDLSSTTIETTASDVVEFDAVLYEETVEASFDLYAYEDLDSGVYELEVEVSYVDSQGRDQIENEFIYIKVNSEESDADTLIIESVTNSKSTILADESFVVTVTLSNEGDEAIEDIEVEISQDEDVIPVTQSIVLINSIGAYESQQVAFKMKSTDSAETSNYPLEVTVTYNDDEEVLTQYTGIYVENDDEDEDDDVTTPRIIIENFTTGLDKIYVGDEFDLDFTLLNTSSMKDIYNLKVIISTEEGNDTTTSILPINQSNSEYVGDLDMGENFDITIPFKVIANAEGAIYSLTIEFEYEDEDGEFYSDSETINIPVYQEPLITISDVSVGTQLDSAYTLEVDFYNTGKVDITNMMVDIEGDFVTTNSNYYVGDFSTGRMDVYDVEITGSLPDTVAGTLIFTYDDTFGEEVEITKEFSLETGSGNDSSSAGMKGEMSEAFGDMTQEEMQEAMASGEMGGGPGNRDMGDASGAASPSNNMILYIIIGGVVVIGAVIVVIIIRRRKKKQAELN